MSVCVSVSTSTSTSASASASASVSVTHTHTHTHTHTLSLSLFHTHTHTHSLSHTHTRHTQRRASEPLSRSHGPAPPGSECRVSAFRVSDFGLGSVFGCQPFGFRAFTLPRPRATCIRNSGISLSGISVSGASCPVHQDNSACRVSGFGLFLRSHGPAPPASGIRVSKRESSLFTI